MYALIQNSPQAIINTYAIIPNPLQLPDNQLVHGIGNPPWYSSDSKYSFVNVIPFSVPNGQITVGNPSYSFNSNGDVIQTISTESIPPLSNAEIATIGYTTAIANGIIISWSNTTSLNGNYAIDSTNQLYITAESVSILQNNTFTNGLTTKNWVDMAGSFHNFSIPSFKAFATGIAQYTDELISVQAVITGGSNTSWPNNSITINM